MTNQQILAQAVLNQMEDDIYLQEHTELEILLVLLANDPDTFDKFIHYLSDHRRSNFIKEITPPTKKI